MVNSAFADLFRFASAAEVLSCGRLVGLFDPCTDYNLPCALYGRRLLASRDGVRFPADIYSRPVLWDGARAVPLSIRDASDEETALGALAARDAGADMWICVARRPALQRAPGKPIETLLVGAGRDEAAALLALNCRATTVATGAHAIRAINARPFDLVILDLQLPGVTAPEMDAFEIAHRIRALPVPWAQAPIIALTPAPTASVRDAVAEASMDAYIRSPADPRRLAEAIAALTRSVDAAELDEVEQEDNDDERGDGVDGDHAGSTLI